MGDQSISLAYIWAEFRRSRVGLAGLTILFILLAVSIIAFTSTPLERLKEWNNPSAWTFYPRSAMPAWVNVLSSSKQPEHLILERPEVSIEDSDSLRIVTHRYTFNYAYDEFPSDFMLNYRIRYEGSAPLLLLTITRPDKDSIELARVSLPYASNEQVYESTLFSTDRAVQDGIANNLSKYRFSISRDATVTAVFSSYEERRVMKGVYNVEARFFLFDERDEVLASRFIVGGKVYGLLGTDDLRRDLSIGLIWGAPIALFIGISVASISVLIGMVYGIISGYKGGSTDEVMMRANDVVYALPALPLLILLAVSVGRSILLIVAYLIIFGWVGIAKVSRSIALQIKSLAYVEAAELMGQSSIKIIFRHIFPQLLPYTFASIAISVPGAIITEAGLSFLGLGDPTMPTWGQILHDANLYGAAARGLWWWIVPPGLMIALTGLAFVLIGNALDAIVNPRLKRL
ncbi:MULTISPECIES: ABC transporter permease [Candidatus Nitrosocaldus]|jgi:peptide/nickel transport system permease protein|uniref:ABC-type dipeptide/oligopeptide/nickel transport system, permease component n=1 Tax=Candidatus Nitrosocaldus cavascurensis TaxID=2058097 RepID=A0A2K5ASX2_9ARCH|nr:MULTISPECIES: ABC transporter permease [Candidatus Nitrosocaldus]SPC34731.1 ABC-type dipeptide/oligopeptide/nickel transport system, permease component [Candidatus Nitrosocaldus cavascurensis]